MLQATVDFRQSLDVVNLIPGLTYRVETTGYERYRPWEPIIKKANFNPQTVLEKASFATHGTLGTSFINFPESWPEFHTAHDNEARLVSIVISVYVRCFNGARTLIASETRGTDA